MLIFLDMNRKKHFFKVILRKPHLRWILLWAKTIFSKWSPKNFSFPRNVDIDVDMKYSELGLHKLWRVVVAYKYKSWENTIVAGF